MSLARLKPRLRRLEELWASETDPMLQYCFAKLYCLECCGWLEQWLDVFYTRIGDHYIVTAKIQEKYKRKVDDTYGFAFDRNIEPLIVASAGYVGVCKVQRGIDVATFEMMKASLGNLKKWRNDLAHPDAEGVQLQAPAPSLCFQNLRNAARGLMVYRRSVRRVLTGLK
jgi:hypothetical protein